MNCLSIREEFIKHYESQGFSLLPQSSMLQVSAPMTYEFSCRPPEPDPSDNHNKYVKTQICFRHFDMTKVAVDNHHLSLFEMGGSFHYGKNTYKETLSQIWLFVTKILKINPNRIWASFFYGGKINQINLAEDTLSYSTWKALGIPLNRIIGLGIEENFWIQSELSLKNSQDNNTNKTPYRKSGVSSELFYDLGTEKACGQNCKPGCSCGRFIEFCNTRFISSMINLDTNDIKPLELPLAETVIGIERVSMLLNNMESVFDLPFYSYLSQCIRQYIPQNLGTSFSVITYYEKIITDHLRALWILIDNNAPAPGRSGRARITRVLIRRLLTCQMALGLDFKALLTLIPLIAQSPPNHYNTNEKLKNYLSAEFNCLKNSFSRSLSNNYVRIPQ